jgi:hypothetical protein
MEAREIEALSMLSRGFVELKEANPELTYNVILDILSGINECVHCIKNVTGAHVFQLATLLYDSMCKHHADYFLTSG